MKIAIVKPLTYLANDFADHSDEYVFEYAMAKTPRQRSLLRSQGIQVLLQQFSRHIQGPHRTSFQHITTNPELDAKLLVLSLWSDEYAQFEYRGKMYRLVTMRILNTTTIRDFVIGAFPAGTGFFSLVSQSILTYH